MEFSRKDADKYMGKINGRIVRAWLPKLSPRFLARQTYLRAFQLSDRTLSGGDGGDFTRGLVADDTLFDPGHEFRHVARHHLPDARSKLV